MATWGEIFKECPELGKYNKRQKMSNKEEIKDFRYYGGRVEVPYHLVESLHLKDCFKDLIILEATNSFSNGMISYVCICRELFSEVPQGGEYPRYIFKPCPHDKKRWILVKAEGNFDCSDFSFLYEADKRIFSDED